MTPPVQHRPVRDGDRPRRADGGRAAGALVGEVVAAEGHEVAPREELRRPELGGDGLRVRFGRIVVLAVEAPNLFANLVQRGWTAVQSVRQSGAERALKVPAGSRRRRGSLSHGRKARRGRGA
jgi:hypothetical protein